MSLFLYVVMSLLRDVFRSFVMYCFIYVVMSSCVCLLLCVCLCYVCSSLCV